MTKLILSCIISSLIFFSTHATDLKITSPLKDSSRALEEECINTLKSMKTSLTGVTPNGNTYNLYAIKRGKEWTYLILDSSGFYSVKQIKGNEEMVENPQTYSEMLCLMAKANLLRVKSKPKNMSGMTFSCYYRFRPKAKQMYRSFNLIQNRVKFIKTNIKGGPAGISKILKKTMK